MCGAMLRIGEQNNPATVQCHVPTPRLDDHQFKEEELGSVGDLSNVCSQIDLQCLYLARIGRPEILRSVNKLARAVTKWTRASDRRLARLISYIHHTSEWKQYHPGKKYRCKSLINSKTMSLDKKLQIYFLQNLSIPKNNEITDVIDIADFYRVQDHGRWCVGAHIQAFTFSSQDHGRLSIAYISKHSPFS